MLLNVCPVSNDVILSEVQTAPDVMLSFVVANGLEGVIAKRNDSIYEPGRRSGAWRKMRINLGQEFVVGGYLPSKLGVDSLVIGFYENDELRYAGRVRAGLIPATRRRIAKELEHLVTEICPFCNLPDRSRGAWGEGITDDVMKKIIWLKPKAVAHIEFLEWTSTSRLRHTKFLAMCYDKDPRMVVRET